MKRSQNLSVWHVQVKVQIMVQRCGNARPAGAKMKEVAMVTGSAAGGIVTGADGAGSEWGTYDTGDDALACGLVRGTAATLCLLGEGAQNSVFIAVEQRLSPAQPEPYRPAEGRKQHCHKNYGKNPKSIFKPWMTLCVKYWYISRATIKRICPVFLLWHILLIH